LLLAACCLLLAACCLLLAACCLLLLTAAYCCLLLLAACCCLLLLAAAACCFSCDDHTFLFQHIFSSFSHLYRMLLFDDSDSVLSVLFLLLRRSSACWPRNTASKSTKTPWRAGRSVSPFDPAFVVTARLSTCLPDLTWITNYCL
jgi:hypothetical protein